MRLGAVLGLWAIAVMSLGAAQAEDQAAPAAGATPAPVTAAPAEPAAPNAVAAAMALPTPYDQEYGWRFRMDLTFFTPKADLPPAAINDANNDSIMQGPEIGMTFKQDNNLRPVLYWQDPAKNLEYELNYISMSQAVDLSLPTTAGRYWIPLADPDIFSYATAADQHLHLQYVEFNALMRHIIKDSEQFRYSVDWGFRFLQVKQHFYGSYTGGDAGGGSFLDMRSSLNAGGLTFGAGLEYTFFNCLTVQGRFGAAILQGSQSGSYDSSLNGGFTVDNTHNANEIVPGLEASAQVTWDPGLELAGGRFLFGGGYEMKNYFGALDVVTKVDDVNTASARSGRTDFNVTGYMLSVQYVLPLN